MAVRIDKDILLKYADKAFLAVAVLFLAITALGLKHGEPKERYDTVVSLYQNDVNKRDQMFTQADKYDQDVRTLLGLPDGDLSNLPKDQAEQLDVYNLLVSTPPFAESFAQEHVTQAPSWADRLQWVPYFASLPSGTNSNHQWLIPTKLIAPTALVLIQDKGFHSSGKDKDKPLGKDLIYISGQARINLAQQTFWSREAAPDSAAIITTLPTDYEIQRRQKLSDGSWGDWQSRAAVRWDQVKDQQATAVNRVKELAAKELDGDSNKGRKKIFIDAVEKFKMAMQSQAKDILHPLFYKMAGKDWLQPYDVRKVSETGATGEPPAEAGFGGQPPALAPAEVPDLWFTDVLAAADVGKTYQYRVRVKFFNPIFNGPSGQTKPEERYLIEIPGAWSEPSDPITVAPLVRFYFTGKFNTGTADRANVELHAWKHGWWYRTKASFEIGDQIRTESSQDIYIPADGGAAPLKFPKEKINFDAGATVVDLGMGTTRYSGNLRPTERLLYWNNLTSQLESRLAWDDKNRAGQDLKKEEAETGKATPTGVTPTRFAPPPGPRPPFPSTATRPFYGFGGPPTPPLPGRLPPGIR